ASPRSVRALSSCQSRAATLKIPTPFASCFPTAPTNKSRRLTFVHVGGFATEQEVLARRCEEIDHLGIFAEPYLVLGTSRNDHNVAGAADPLFAAEPKLHLALEHPHDLLVCVAVRLDMNSGLDAPPYEHLLVARQNAAADLFGDLFLR